MKDCVKVIGISLSLIVSLMFIVSIIVKFVDNMRIRTSMTEKILTSFQGDNVYASFYHKGIGGKKYDSIESILEDELEYRKKTQYLGDNDLEEIYRIQVGEKIFVYLKQREVKIVEYEFFRQDDLYYCSGSKGLSYNGVGSSGSYTAEETIRKDIANTMWRGVGSEEVGAPAWGVSTDENISSMTINSENVNDVIQISEIDGKKILFLDYNEC